MRVKRVSIKCKGLTMTKEEKQRLAELHKTIKDEVPHVNTKEHSHNIISWTLRIISQEFGYNEANKTIGKFKLNLYGWKHETPKEGESNEKS